MGEYYWHDFVGNVGVFLILLCYFLLQIENMKSDGVLYSALNGVGAVLILVSLAYNFNLSAFIIELAWVAISVLGIYKYYYQRRRLDAGNGASKGQSS